MLTRSSPTQTCKALPTGQEPPECRRGSGTPWRTCPAVRPQVVAPRKRRPPRTRAGVPCARRSGELSGPHTGGRARGPGIGWPSRTAGA
eukprot:15485289-Alexandrium_andersonii.AAC.1